ncbi:MAG: PKD domain-containing protein, partial [Flavobacteriaceae bacterium]|nr:PKD domain-containing protein [Flavobacteriaceae bacterium]
ISGADSVAQMFSGATSFNQDIGNWDISGLNNSRPASIAGANNMFAGVTLSTENYDSLLIGWNSLDPGETLIPTNISLSGGNSTYCSGAAARNNLSTVKGWTITDQGSSTELPNAICMDIIVLLDSNGNATITADQLNNGSGDSCGTATLSISNSTFNCSNLGENTVQLTITDSNGNTSTCNAIVTVKDEINPIVITQNITVQLDSNGNGLITTALVNNGSSDNCEIASMSLDKTTFDCSNVGDNTVILTVIDTSGNEATATATVEVLGVQAAFTTDSNAVCRNIVINFTDTSTASGSETITSWLWDFGDGNTSSVQNPSHSYGIPNVYVVSLTTTSSNGCESTTSTSITVHPPIADFTLTPEIGCETPHTVFFTDLSTQPDIWLWEFGDGSTSTAQNPVHNYTTYGDFPVRLWVQDTIYGCSDIKERLVKVAAVQTNFTLNGTTNAFGCGPLDVNFVDTSVILGNDTIDTWLWDFGDGESSTEQNPTHIYEQPGVYSPTLTTILAITGCINVKTSVVQVIGPNIDFETTSTTSGCPPLDIQFNDLTIFGAPIVAWIWDFGDGNTSNFQNPLHQYTSFGVFDVSLTIIDIDGCSRTMIKTAFVDTSDNIAPTAICQNMVVQLDANGEVSITTDDIDNGSSDNCGAVSMALDIATFNCTNLGVNTVILTVTDNNGNTDFCTATVTVEDNIDPTWDNAPSDLIVECDGTSDPLGAFATWLTSFSGTDACGTAIITNNSTGLSDNCGATGTETVTFTLTDECGNTITQSATFTIEDTTAPTIVCPMNVDISTDPGVCGAEVDFPMAVALDSCGSVTVAQTGGLPSNSFFPVGVSIVEFTATDECGNTTVCSFIITVTDNEVPVTVCQDITIQLDELGNASIVAADIDGGSTDNCGVAPISASQTDFDCSDVGDNNVMLTVTDINGNTSTCIAVVTVEDITLPSVICQNITVQLGTSGTVTISGNDVDGGSTDACGIASYVSDINTFDCSNIGDNTVVLTVTDVNGNTSTCTAIVTVEDTTSPELICMNITVELDGNGMATIIPSDVIENLNDACGINTSAVDITEFYCSDIGNPVTVQVFAEDVNGNLTTCYATVTVVDLLAPVLTCPEDQTQDPGPGNLFWEVPDFFANGEATTTDNCTDPVEITTQDPAAGTLLPDGTYTVTMTAEDEYGNVGTCDFELIIESLLGVGDFQDLVSIILYPNPAKDYIRLSNPSSLPLNKISIYDLNGRLLITSNLDNMGIEKQLDISKLATASYLIIIESNNDKIVKMLIKE